MHNRDSLYVLKDSTHERDTLRAASPETHGFEVWKLLHTQNLCYSGSLKNRMIFSWVILLVSPLA
jgi:hypothetical protein